MNKYYLEKAAKFLSPALYYSQLHRITKPFYSGIGSILMFHRVLPESKKLRIHNHKSLEITPDHLESIILHFKKEGYRPITLDDLVRNISQFEKQKFVIYTFDDGYVDNYVHAYPVFQKHGVPFTIYVTTSLPDGTAVLWWYLLEEFIVRNSKVVVNFRGGKRVINARTVKEKEVAFNEVRSVLAEADASSLRSQLNSLLEIDSDEVKFLTRKLALSWEQVVELSKDARVTIGSHTVNHYPLNSLSYEESAYEINHSMKILNERGVDEVRHFCYPLGSYGEKEIQILESSKYLTATTIKMANIMERSLDYPFALPRIMINRLTDKRILQLQVNGLLPALRNKFRKVVR